MDKKSLKSVFFGLFFLGIFTSAVFLFHSCGNNPADAIFDATGQSSVIFVKEPSQNARNRTPMESNAEETGSDYRGSDIYLLSPASKDGNLTNLTGQYTKGTKTDSSDWGMAEDPEVSYDGKKIIFSMRRFGSGYWHLYEMNLDGSGLVELTADIANDMDPYYLPDGNIVFTSTRNNFRDEYERKLVPQLHVGEKGPTGKLINIRCISMNQSHDNNPIVHSSGKIFYSRWEHLGDPNKFPLFSINSDGTGAFVLYGNHSPSQSGSRVFLEVRELSDKGLVSSVMERTSPFEGGAIAIIDLLRSDNSIKFITPATVPFNNSNAFTTALYKTPYPVMDDGEERLFVAKSPYGVSGMTDSGIVDYGIYIMDLDGSHEQLVYNDRDNNELDPIAVHVAIKPPVYNSDPAVAAALANPSGEKRGMFFDGNVYHRGGSNLDGQFKPDSNFINTDGSKGQAKYVRVLEAVLLKGYMDIGMTNFEKQRVVGYADVRLDGSFSIDVPANRALHVQTLDENGMALVNQLTWIQVMPGERRLCTGCHDSHDRDKIISDFFKNSNGSVYNQAMGYLYNSGFDSSQDVHPAQRVEAYAHSGNTLARGDTVNFFETAGKVSVQSAFNAKCNSCHGISSFESQGGGRLLQEDSSRIITGIDMNGNTKKYRITSYQDTVELEYSWVYDELFDGRVQHASTGSNRELVSDYGARRSPLLWVLFGKQLDTRYNSAGTYKLTTDNHTGLWSKDANNRIDPFLPANKDLLVLIEWLDMGAQYQNSGY